MNASSPQSDSLEQTTLEVEGHQCLVQYSLFLSNQGEYKICKYSQSPFNQFSFSILSLFLRLKTGPNYGCGSEENFESLFWTAFLPNAVAPANYLFLDIYDNDVPIL